MVRLPGRPVMRCSVLNISKGGALLDFGTEVWLPFQFRLVWEGKDRAEDCEIKHAKGSRVGVQFIRNGEAVIDDRPRSSLQALDDKLTWQGEVGASNHAPGTPAGHPPRR